MRFHPATVLSAATVVAALGLSGCAEHDRSQPAPNATAPPPVSAVAPATDPGPLPAPEALTDVLYRLADPAVPGSDKLQLVENTTPEDAATIDKFATALRDGGFTPLTFTAGEIRWSEARPQDALATIDVTTSNPAKPGAFTFPMEFAPFGGGWQLSKGTADMLLAFGDSRTEPSPGPSPAAPPTR